MQQYTFDWPNGQICNLRQFPYNSKKQCNNRLYGALASATPIAGIAPSTLPEGTLLRLGENGKGVLFYLAKHDYQSDLNGEGFNLCVRKDIYEQVQFVVGGNSLYANGPLDTSQNITYKEILDEDIKSKILETRIYYTPGGSNQSISTISRFVFSLSGYEYGQTLYAMNNEGSILPTADMIRISNFNGVAANHWTRSPRLNPQPTYACYIRQNGSIHSSISTNELGSRPAFCIPNDLLFNSEPNSDGSYSPVGSPYAD